MFRGIASLVEHLRKRRRNRPATRRFRSSGRMVSNESRAEPNYCSWGTSGWFEESFQPLGQSWNSGAYGPTARIRPRFDQPVRRSACRYHRRREPSLPLRPRRPMTANGRWPRRIIRARRALIDSGLYNSALGAQSLACTGPASMSFRHRRRRLSLQLRRQRASRAVALVFVRLLRALCGNSARVSVAASTPQLDDNRCHERLRIFRTAAEYVRPTGTASPFASLSCSR